MTSRRDEGRSADELDDMIQAALCESVAGATPPLSVWKRIQKSIERPATLGQAWTWKRVASLLKAAAAYLSRVDALIMALETPSIQWDGNRTAGYDLDWVWLNQHRMIMRLVC
jgi:hypothetical protein